MRLIELVLVCIVVTVFIKIGTDAIMYIRQYQQDTLLYLEKTELVLQTYTSVREK